MELGVGKDKMHEHQQRGLNLHVCCAAVQPAGAMWLHYLGEYQEAHYCSVWAHLVMRGAAWLD